MNGDRQHLIELRKVMNAANKRVGQMAAELKSGPRSEQIGIRDDEGVDLDVEYDIACHVMWRARTAYDEAIAAYVQKTQEGN